MQLQLNNVNALVEDFRAGNEEALDTLCRMFLPVINKHAESIWYLIENEAEFECRCLVKLQQSLRKFNPSKSDATTFIHNVIKREKADFLSRRRREAIDSLDAPIEGKDGDIMTLEVPDVLADVENIILSKEKVVETVALLAKGDRRREHILKAWMQGESNDSELAKELADSFPSTNAESNRKFIQRFRRECMRALSSA